MSRRRMLAGLGVGAAGLALASCAGSESGGGSPSATTLPQDGGAATLGGGRVSLFDQTDLDFQTLFALGEAGQTSAAGEVLSVVAQANAADGGASYQTVFDAWVAMGNLLEEKAVASERGGNRTTSRSEWIRASRYYSQALYWVLGTSTPGAEREVYTAMAAAFEAGLRLGPHPVERTSVRWSGGEFPAWLIEPDDGGDRRPTFVINNGSDGQTVDLLGQGGLAALARGYNLVIFEGPGQGSQLFVDDVPFTPDWHEVITPLVDWLGTRAAVDDRRIALRGISFGGLLVPKAAATETRLAAIVADPGALATKNDYPPIIQDAGEAGSPEKVNATWNDLIVKGATPIERFNLMKSMEIFTTDAHDAARRGELVTDFDPLWTTILAFDVTEDLPRITTPTLVTQYEADAAFGTQGREMYDRLEVATKDFHEFTAVVGAQFHCGPANPQVSDAVILDWVDGVMKG